jgi:hypothetical protein
LNGTARPWKNAVMTFGLKVVHEVMLLVLSHQPFESSMAPPWS